MQALALNFNAYLKDSYVYYDAGDEWAYGADEIGYRTTLVFPAKTAPSVQQLQKSFDTYKHILEEGTFSQELANQVENYAKGTSSPYFDQYTLNEITGGIVIGGKGWKKVSSPKSSRRLVADTEATVL